jgi:hypothetical protein
MIHDFIPQADRAFLDWATILVSYVVPRGTNFNIPAAELTPIQAKLLAYTTAFEAAQQLNRGKLDVMRKNETRKTLKAALRLFVKEYLAYNHAVSDLDRENMGLPLHNTHAHTRLITTIPELEFDVSILRQVTVYFRDTGSHKRSKPARVHGIEICWAVLDHAPASVKALSSSVFATANPYTFAFDESDRGKTLYLCARWENSATVTGPFGEIVKTIIP